MKKTYINPSIEVIRIQTATFLASSVEMSTDVTPTPGNTLSREVDFTDDEDW